MQTVTNEQIYERWERVPESLKEAFFSTEHGEVIWKSCEDLGLSEDVIDGVLMVMGNVLLGFTHVNDLAKELQSIAGMDPKAIDPIVFQIDRRVFATVKGDILKLYGEMSGTGPRIVAEEKPAAPGSIAPAMIANGEAQVEIRKIRIGDDGKEQTPVPAEVKADQTPIAAPTIIHSEAELKPVAQKSRSLSSFGGMFGFRREQGKKPEDHPAIAAQVSMIEGLGKKPEDMARTAQQPVRVVHYTSAKAPEDLFVQTAQAQGAIPAIPVTKQEHLMDFEPKVIDLAAPESVVGKMNENIVTQGAQPVMPSQGEAQAVPMPAMPNIPETMVMKTPQRVETVAEQAPAAKEPQLAEIPVSDDIVDLRMLERIDRPLDKK